MRLLLTTGWRWFTSAGQSKHRSLSRFPRGRLFDPPLDVRREVRLENRELVTQSIRVYERQATDANENKDSNTVRDVNIYRSSDPTEMIKEMVDSRNIEMLDRKRARKGTILGRPQVGQFSRRENNLENQMSCGSGAVTTIVKDGR